MNRVVRGSSLLIVTAIVAACAAQREEGKADADRQGPQPPAAEEVDASLNKVEARDAASVSEIVVTGSRAARTKEQSSPMTVATTSPAAFGTVCCPPVYQQPANTERYQHMDDNPVHLVAEQPVSTFSI